MPIIENADRCCGTAFPAITGELGPRWSALPLPTRYAASRSARGEADCPAGATRSTASLIRCGAAWWINCSLFRAAAAIARYI